MKTKFFLFALVVAFMACSTNDPEKKELLGTWSEPYHVDIMVKTMTFNDDGTLTYTNRPDTTWDVVIDYAGEFAQLRYTAKNHQLHISGERKDYDNTIGKMVYEPFTFSTGYSIKENVLTLDSFSYDGGYDSKYYKPLILYKQ